MPRVVVLLLVLFTCTAGGKAQGFGTALHFSGTETIRGQFTLPQNTAEFTIEIRFLSLNPAPSSGMPRILCWNDSNRSRLEIGETDGYLRFVFDNPVCNYLPESQAYFIGDGHWHEAALTFSKGTLAWYLDGEMLDFVHGDFNFQHNQELLLGRWYNGENWQGCLDELRVWSTALPPETIRSGNSKPLAAGQTKNLALHLDFEQGKPGGDNRQIQFLKPRTGAATLPVSGFGMTEPYRSNFVDAAYTDYPKPLAQEEEEEDVAPMIDETPVRVEAEPGTQDPDERMRNYFLAQIRAAGNVDPKGWPELGKLYSALGWYELMIGRPKEARVAIETALQLDSTNQTPHTNLPHCFFFVGQKTEALRRYSSWMNKPRDTNRTFREVFLQDLNDFEKKGLIRPELVQDLAEIRAVLNASKK
ncbi:MAG: LamG domain-containing protein [Saprospiraceae bacterium]|nr:LamG domain-containing protein [Saprospiraceae bacterium]